MKWVLWPRVKGFIKTVQSGFSPPLLIRTVIRMGNKEMVEPSLGRSTRITREIHIRRNSPLLVTGRADPEFGRTAFM